MQFSPRQCTQSIVPMNTHTLSPVAEDSTLFDHSVDLVVLVATKNVQIETTKIDSLLVYI